MTYTVYMNKGYAQEQLLIATGNKERAYETARKYKGQGIIEIQEHSAAGVFQIEQYLE